MISTIFCKIFSAHEKETRKRICNCEDRLALLSCRIDKNFSAKNMKHVRTKKSRLLETFLRAVSFVANFDNTPSFIFHSSAVKLLLSLSCYHSRPAKRVEE